MRIAVLTAFIALLAAPAWALEPIAYTPSSQDFAEQMAKRYAQGGDYAAAKADAEANGFACEAYPPQAPAANAPTHECIKLVAEGNCRREYAIELRQDGARLRAPAEASTAPMCLGAVLPRKPR